MHGMWFGPKGSGLDLSQRKHVLISGDSALDTEGERAQVGAESPTSGGFPEVSLRHRGQEAAVELGFLLLGVSPSIDEVNWRLVTLEASGRRQQARTDGKQPPCPNTWCSSIAPLFVN